MIGTSVMNKLIDIGKPFPQDKLLSQSIQRISQPAITYSKLTVETLEQSMKYVQS